MTDTKASARADRYIRFCPLDEDNRQILQECVKHIGDITGGFAPSLNKVVNDILREADLERVQLHYISQIQQGTLQANNETDTNSE